MSEQGEKNPVIGVPPTASGQSLPGSPFDKDRELIGARFRGEIENLLGRLQFASVVVELGQRLI